MTKETEIVYNNNQEDYKYKSWIFTWNVTHDGVLIDEERLEALLRTIAVDYAFQLERVTRLHYQGYFNLVNRTRKGTLLNRIRFHCMHERKDLVDNLTISNIKGTPAEAIAYVTKSDSRVSPPVYSMNLLPYLTTDLAVLSCRDKWYPWQGTLSDMLINQHGTIKTPDDRTIIWIQDEYGNSGKSKLVKFYVSKYPQEIVKLPFGSASQLRSAICTAGPKKVYFIDIPRTMSRDEDFDTIYSVIEDIKNGFITTSMYGQFKQLMFNPPHIVVFSNFACPYKKLSLDRWAYYKLVNKQLI